jgi:hypothetical protein
VAHEVPAIAKRMGTARWGVDGKICGGLNLPKSGSGPTVKNDAEVTIAA